LLECSDKLIDIATVHINKFVLLALFLVSVSRPTVLNALLFIMFLILSMVNHQNEYRYLRLTLFINSLTICIIFTFDTFIQRDFSSIRTWVLHLIGVQYRSENVSHDLVKLKYLPYICLQVILCLSSYVFQSDRYKLFKKQYMDIDSQKKSLLVKQMTMRQKASERAMSSK
jgi:energy-coupling factor transporter transmembrane protein EcfT